MLYLFGILIFQFSASDTHTRHGTQIMPHPWSDVINTIGNATELLAEASSEQATGTCRHHSQKLGWTHVWILGFSFEASNGDWSRNGLGVCPPS